VRDKVFRIVDQLPGKPDQEVAAELASYLVGFFSNMAHCSFTPENFATYARLVGEALEHRGLNRKRLTRSLRRYSKKWPPAFSEALP
jgi:hypothetical protein